MPGIDRELIKAQLERLQTSPRQGIAVPEGEYVVRVLSVQPAADRFGRPMKRATFEVAEGAHAGQKIETPIWGHAERRLASAARGTLFTLAVYTHRHEDGREYRRVNVEAIRLHVSPPTGATTSTPTAVSGVEPAPAAASEFIYGFCCHGSISAPRKVVGWRDSFTAMARCDTGMPIGQVVFLSAFTFTTALKEHQQANDRRAEARGERRVGSMEGFRGACYASLLTFDTDCRDAAGNPDPGGCQHSAVALATALLELGVAPDDILTFFSGSKGFHVAIPATLAGAVPSGDFHLIAKEFCRLVADEAGVVIDESLYRTLQPLRAPNSRHEKTGLYKVWLMLEELIELPFGAIREIARKPRVFELPAASREPLPLVATLWQQAEQAVRAAAAVRVQPPAGGDAEAGITRATWDYLINGAEPGSRAESHFKAAANLADFGSLDVLIHALLKRPAVISGLPAREAEGHVASALRRAGGQRDQQEPPPV
jgi:hypothetical protein